MHASRAGAAPTAKAAVQLAAHSAWDPRFGLGPRAVPVATRWLHVPPQRKRTQPLSQLSPSFYWLLDLGWNLGTYGLARGFASFFNNLARLRSSGLWKIARLSPCDFSTGG
jgi:hypothetical protein